MDIKKPVLLHFHIFKNAGITMEWILEKNFQKSYSMESYGHAHRGIIPMDALIRYLETNDEIKVFSSHNIRYPIPQHPKLEFLPILLIREPMDRAFSIYSFNRRTKNKDLHSFTAKKLSLANYIRWNLRLNNRMMNDHLLSFFNYKTKVPFQHRFSNALNAIKNCTLLGIVDRFDESMTLAEETLKPYFGNLDFSYISQNVSTERQGTLQDKIKAGSELIGEKLMNKLIKKNQNDTKLYNHAKSELDYRISRIENFNEKVLDFRKRVNKLKEKQEKFENRGHRLIYLEKGNELKDI